MAPAFPVKIEEIDHVAIDQAVDGVAERATEYQRQGPAKHALAGVLSEQVDDVAGRAQGDGREKVALPAALVGQKTERGAPVIPQHQVEIRGNDHFLRIAEGALYHDFAELVEQYDDGGDAVTGNQGRCWFR